MSEIATPESRARWIFAGLLAVVALAVLGWYRVTTAGLVTYEIRTRDNVSGLMVDAPVEFHGVDVGKVAAVDLVAPELVRVLLHIHGDAPVSAATVATITSRGLASKGFTGYVYVALENDAAAAGAVAQADARGVRELRVAPSRSVNLDTAIAQVNANVEQMNRLLQSTLDERSVARLKQTLENMDRVTAALARNTDRIESVASNVERASRRLEPLLESTARTAQAMQSEVLPQAYKAFVAVDGASTSWRSTAERAASGLDPLLASGQDSALAVQTQLLPQASQAVAHLQRLTIALDGLAKRLDRDPSLLLRGARERPAGPGETP